MEYPATLNHQTLTIGKISRVKQGIAQTVCDDNGIEYQVVWVSHNMPRVREAHRVIFYPLNCKAVLLYLLQPIEKHLPKQSFEQVNNNKMRLQFGRSKIEIESSGKLSLQINKHHLTIDEQGALLCQANQITFHAKESITLACQENDIQFETDQ